MTNSNLLKGAIKSKGLTIAEAAKSIGLSRTSLSYKINNIRSFTADEIINLVNLLDIEDKDKYFFARDAAVIATKEASNE